MSNVTSEEWRPIPGFPSYEVSSHGRVRKWHVSGTVPDGEYRYRNLRKKRTSPYIQVDLWLSGKVSWRSVHRLMWEAFVGGIPKGWHVCHNDGDSTNNVLTNLRCDTARENSNDRRKHGTLPHGETHPMVKLTEEAVAAIKARVQEGAEPQWKIARDWGVSRPTVSAIATGRLWKHLNGE